MELKNLKPNESDLVSTAKIDDISEIINELRRILFLNCDAAFAFLFKTEAIKKKKKRRLPEKDSLKCLFFYNL